jgi:hypothetical protein
MTTITSKFSGKCACGSKVQAGEQIRYERRFAHPLCGCSACQFGTFPGMSRAALSEHIRALHVLANNAITIRSPRTGALLTQIDLAAEAARAV